MITTSETRSPVVNDTQGLQEEIHNLHWFHSIDFGKGIITSGHKSIDLLQAEADAYFSCGIAGRSFLDVGCWDGANSLAAWKRGARRVVATDHYVWIMAQAVAIVNWCASIWLPP
jgi:tRNA (mo5U34)-methyltransferase